MEELVQKYIDSVEGDAHMSAVNIIRDAYRQGWTDSLEVNATRPNK